MKHLASLLLPAALGLVAGIGHGVMSHYADLPLSLTDQMLQSIQPEVQPEVQPDMRP